MGDLDVRQGGLESEITAEDHALSELSTLTQHRRARLLQSTSGLPGIFWCVLLVGGILTLVSVSMFGSANPKLHSARRQAAVH